MATDLCIRIVNARSCPKKSCRSKSFKNCPKFLSKIQRTSSSTRPGRLRVHTVEVLSIKVNKSVKTTLEETHSARSAALEANDIGDLGLE